MWTEVWIVHVTTQRWCTQFFIPSMVLEFKIFPSHPAIVKENVDSVHRVTLAFIFYFSYL
jgi:hypothetical protein